uniref:Secreted protein n=1 Tax=Steinernema glaseri TaxID=37863 RepID=A0A1I7YDK9_9BILA
MVWFWFGHVPTKGLKMEWPAATGSRVPTLYRLQHASSTHLDTSHDKASDVKRLGNLGIAAPPSTDLTQGSPGNEVCFANNVSIVLALKARPRFVRFCVRICVFICLDADADADADANESWPSL